jgi:hypothetical protein
MKGQEHKFAPFRLAHKSWALWALEDGRSTYNESGTTALSQAKLTNRHSLQSALVFAKLFAFAIMGASDSGFYSSLRK